MLASPPNADRELPRRIVHVFDFNERERGNLEDVPMYWTPIREPGYPHFATGRLDLSDGADAPPSFCLTSSGRNVGYGYAGPATPVHFANTYRIAARIRPSRLNSARAFVEAYFLDAHGRCLPGTVRRSSMVASASGALGAGVNPDGSPKPEPWTDVTIDLPPAPESAATIGLSLLVAQRESWDLSRRPAGFIELVDVQAKAWFDDVTVYALPRIDVDSSAPAYLFSQRHPERLSFRVTADDVRGLSLSMEIVSDDGRIVTEQSGEVMPGSTATTVRFDPSTLAPGLYKARLRIVEDQTALIGRTVDFVVVAPLRSGAEAPASRPFGIVLDNAAPTDAAYVSTILSQIGAHGVKVRLNPESAASRGLSEDASSRSSLSALRGLARERVTLTGVLPQQPFAALRDAGWATEGKAQAQLSAGDVLRLRTADWITSNASLVQVFQIGADGESVTALDEAYVGLLNRLRQELMRYSSNLRLAVPCLLTSPPTVESLEGLRLSAAWPVQMDVEDGAARVAALRKLRPAGIDLFVRDDAATESGADAGLASWARALICALYAQPDTVYVAQVWKEHTDGAADGVGLSARALVLRALADLLSDAQPGPVLHLSETARGVVFLRGETALMACWDTGAPAAPAAMQLGGSPRVLDLWGRPGELSADDKGRRVLALGPMPVLIDDIPAWVFKFQQTVALQPRLLPFSLEPQVRTLSLTNPSSSLLSGEAQIIVPDGWEVRPPQIHFELPAGATVDLPLELRYPSNESAGVKNLTLNITVAGNPPLVFESRVELELGLPDIEVSATAVVDGTTVMIHQLIRNRSDKSLSFRGFAGPPGQPRQYHQVSDLAPGESRVETYQFFNAAGLSGQTVRVGLREMEGSRLHNLDVKIP